MRLPHQFQGQKVKVNRPINGDTHRPPYLLNGKAYELQSWYTDRGRRPASGTGSMTSKVKGQGRKVTWSVWAVLAQCCTCVISSWRGHTVSAESGGHTWCCFCKTISQLALWTSSCNTNPLIALHNLSTAPYLRNRSIALHHLPTAALMTDSSLAQRDQSIARYGIVVFNVPLNTL